MKLKKGEKLIVTGGKGYHGLIIPSIVTVNQTCEVFDPDLDIVDVNGMSHRYDREIGQNVYLKDLSLFLEVEIIC